MKLEERFHRLREECPKCFADEISDFHPRSLNRILAAEFMKNLGNPKCKCSGENRIKFKTRPTSLREVSRERTTTQGD